MAVRWCPIAEKYLRPESKKEEGAGKNQEADEAAIVESEGRFPRPRSERSRSRIASTAKPDAQRVEDDANGVQEHQEFHRDRRMRKESAVSDHAKCQNPGLAGEITPEDRFPGLVLSHIALSHLIRCNPATKAQRGSGWRISDPSGEEHREEDNTEDGETASAHQWQGPDNHPHGEIVIAGVSDVCKNLFEGMVERIVCEAEECYSRYEADQADDHAHGCTLLEGTHTGREASRSMGGSSAGKFAVFFERVLHTYVLLL